MLIDMKNISQMITSLALKNRMGFNRARDSFNRQSLTMITAGMNIQNFTNIASETNIAVIGIHDGTSFACSVIGRVLSIFVNEAINTVEMLWLIMKTRIAIIMLNRIIRPRNFLPIISSSLGWKNLSGAIAIVLRNPNWNMPPSTMKIPEPIAVNSAAGVLGSDLGSACVNNSTPPPLKRIISRTSGKRFFIISIVFCIWCNVPKGLPDQNCLRR